MQNYYTYCIKLDNCVYGKLYSHAIAKFVQNSAEWNRLYIINPVANINLLQMFANLCRYIFASSQNAYILI